eukprot:5714763-Amphidinium_carterae.2
MARPGNYKPPHRLTGKQPPPTVAQLGDILEMKEITLENSEDREKKHRRETSMKDIQVQPWWQSEDDITMFSEHLLKEAVNKEFAQVSNKTPFTKSRLKRSTAGHSHNNNYNKWLLQNK